MASKILGKNIELRKAIIKKYVNENGFVPIIEMLEYLTHLKNENKEFKYKKLDYRNLHEGHLKRISGKDGVLGNMESAIIKEQALKGYSIKKNLETLGIIFYHVYADRDRWELLRTPYFNDLIDTLIENFNRRLEHSTLNHRLRPGEVEYLIFCIRYPSVTSFVLSERISFERVFEYQKTQNSRLLSKMKKPYKSRPPRNGTLKKIYELMDELFKKSSVWLQVFETLVQHDRFLGRVPVDIDKEYQQIIEQYEQSSVDDASNYVNKKRDKIFS